MSEGSLVMGIKSLMSVAHAAGLAMAASEELLTPAGRSGVYETRGLEHEPSASMAAPGRWAQSVPKVDWPSRAVKAGAMRDWVVGLLPSRATA